MTTQDAYEMMRVYLTRPGARQAVQYGTTRCSYEIIIDTEVHRCAVGCLLSPGAISQLTVQGLLQSGVMSLFREDKNLFAGHELADVDQNFLSIAQSVHDDAENWGPDGFLVGRLDDLAERFALEVVTEDEPARAVAFA